MGDSDYVIQKMVDDKVCKEYVRNGVAMISFFEDMVGSKEGTRGAFRIGQAMHTCARTYAR